jgi:hypothetical protein
MEMYKDVPIGEHKYRIGRLSARTGSWILTLSIKELQGSLSESEYSNIQQHLLSVCSRFVNDHPVPVLKVDGSFSPKAADLEYDLDALLKLQKEAKDFNFADFFSARAREIEKAKALDPTSGSTTA